MRLREATRDHPGAAVHRLSLYYRLNAINDSLKKLKMVVSEGLKQWPLLPQYTVSGIPLGSHDQSAVAAVVHPAPERALQGYPQIVGQVAPPQRDSQHFWRNRDTYNTPPVPILETSCRKHV